MTLLEPESGSRQGGFAGAASQASTGRADLIRALGVGRLDEMARLLGYEATTERAHGASGPAPATTETNSRPKVRKPAVPTVPPAMFWRPEVYEALKPEEAERRHAEDLVRLNECLSNELGPGGQQAGPPEPARLGDFPQIASALRRCVARPHPVRAPDVSRLVRYFSRAEGLRRVPRLHRPRWGGAVRVLVDRADHLKPYDRDFDRIVDDIERLFPFGAMLDDLCRGPEGVPTGFAEEGLIVLSDLGALSPSPLTAMEAWRRVGLGLRSNGLVPAAILPAAPRTPLGGLTDVWSLCAWERWWLGGPVAEGALRRMEAIVAPAVRVEPGLLRGLRLLLARHPEQGGVAPPAWTESAFWMSSYFVRRCVDGAAPDPERRKAALIEFGKLDGDLRQAAIDLIESWRTASPWAAAEELMGLDSGSRRRIGPRRVAEAAERFQAFAASLAASQGGGRGEASYFRRFVERFPSEALEGPDGGDDIEATAVRVMRTAISRASAAVFPKESSKAWPPGALPLYRPDLLEMTPIPKSRIDVRQIGGELAIGDGSDAGSLLVTVGVQRPELIVEPLPPFWKSGTPPTWADAWGCDRFGPWAQFSVPVKRGPSVTQRLRWIPPGEFLMGSPDDEPGRASDEGPRHLVTISKGYWLSDTACTQALWRAVMGRNPSRFKSPDRPVDSVSWNDARTFIERINGLAPGLDVCLPSEAQWEYACRAGTETPFCFGDNIDPTQVNYDGNYPYGPNAKGLYREQTVAVGSLPANALGLYEIHGNVSEWCADAWRSSYDGAPTDGTTWLGGQEGVERVLRGGSWDLDAAFCRSACRDVGVADGRDSLNGFRCARVQDGAEPGGARRIRPAELRIAARLSSGAEPARLIASGPGARRALPAGSPFVIRSDCEHLTFGLAFRPRWASAIGRDGFGLWTEFEITGEAWPPVRQRMRWIPPGRFTMGSPDDEPGRDADEGPRHPVTISVGFWMFDTPCTQALWQVVMGKNPSRFRSPDRPAETVAWNDAQEFIARINGKVEGLSLVLPTEAQWEYACRAGTDTALYTGSIDILGANNAPSLDTIAWYCGNSGRDFGLDDGNDRGHFGERQYSDRRGGTHPVSCRAANPWGLHDMIGNVWEWCEDGRRKYGPKAETDPVGRAGVKRVLRGGSWGDDAWYCRSAYRNWSDADDRSSVIGFRCARAQT